MVMKHPAPKVKVNAQGVPITESDEITADLHVRLNFSTWNGIYTEHVATLLWLLDASR